MSIRIYLEYGFCFEMEDLPSKASVATSVCNSVFNEHTFRLYDKVIIDDSKIEGTISKILLPHQCPVGSIDIIEVDSPQGIIKTSLGKLTKAYQ